MLGTLFLVTYPVIIVTTMINYFEINSKIKTILMNLFFVCFNFYLLSFDDFTANCILIFSLVLWLCIEKRKIKLEFFAVPFFLVMLFIFTQKFAVVFLSLITKCDILTLFKNGESSILYFEACTFGNMVLLFLCYFFNDFFKKKQTKQVQQLSLFVYVFFFLIVLMTMGGALDASTHTGTNQKELVKIFVTELLFVLMFSLHLYYLQKQAKKKNLELASQLMSEKFHKQMYGQMNYMTHQIASDKHMMIYHLMKISQFLNEKKYDEAKSYVDDRIKKLTNHVYLDSSVNPIFDEMMTKLSNQLKENQIETKMVISVEKENEVLNQMSTISLMENIKTCILNQKDKIHLVEFFFEQIQDGVKLKVIIHHQGISDMNIGLDDDQVYYEHNDEFETIKILLRGSD